MRKLAKAICFTLSLTLLVNMAGFEVLATDTGTAQDEAGKVAADTKADADQGTVSDADKGTQAEAEKNTQAATDKKTDAGDETDADKKEDVSDDKKDNSSEDQTGAAEGDEPKQSEKPENDTDDTNETQEEPSGPAVNEPVKEPENELEKEDDTDKKKEDSEAVKVEVKTAEDLIEIKGLTAEPAKDNQLKISWGAVSEASQYQVKVLKYSDSSLVKKYETTDTDCLVKVTKGTKYYIEVTALKEQEKTQEPEANQTQGDDQSQGSGQTQGSDQETGKTLEITEIAIGKIPAVLLANPSVKTKAGAASVKLSWKSVTGADKYQVKYKDTKSRTKNVTEKSYEAKKLKYGKKYSFTVQAVCEFKEEDKTYTYVSDQVKVSETTLKEKPDKVKKLTGIDGDESEILTWSKAARAESYVVYRYNASKKKWEVVKKNVKKLTYTDKKLKQGKIYKYRVAASNNGGIGEKSSTVSISVKKTPEKVRSIGYKAVVKSRAPLFTTPTSKKRVRYLSAGTRVTTIDFAKNRYQIKLSNGKSYWLAKGRLSFRASVWTSKDYSTKTKEDFVNKKGYKSKTKYLIWVSQYTQKVVIYKGSKGKWKVVRSGPCCTGTHKNMTPKKLMYITYRKKGRYYRTQYESPIVFFTTGNAFHSRIKLYSGGYADATIGRPKSHGCVRLLQGDIDYIYKYCPRGTTIVSY